LLADTYSDMIGNLCGITKSSLGLSSISNIKWSGIANNMKSWLNGLGKYHFPKDVSPIWFILPRRYVRFRSAAGTSAYNIQLYALFGACPLENNQHEALPSYTTTNSNAFQNNWHVLYGSIPTRERYELYTWDRNALEAKCFFVVRKRKSPSLHKEGCFAMKENRRAVSIDHLPKFRALLFQLPRDSYDSSHFRILHLQLSCDLLDV